MLGATPGPARRGMLQRQASARAGPMPKDLEATACSMAERAVLEVSKRAAQPARRLGAAPPAQLARWLGAALPVQLTADEEVNTAVWRKLLDSA